MKTMSSSIFKYLLAALALAMPLSAQNNADPLVYTVGKTFETNAGATLHNYVLWQPGDARTTFGKKFGIYAKDGNANSPNPYTRLGIQTLQTSPSAIQALLKLGEKFDADGEGLPEMIVALNAEANATPLPDGFAFPSEINLDVAQKLAQIMTIAQTDAEVLQSLVSLGRAHPGVQMAIGLGWSIETTPSTVITYEVRELDLADNDVRVIGRVTLDSDNPQMLLAPGRPYQLPHEVDPDLQLAASAKDHLAVRLRWSTPNGLRTLLPHTYGFNLYRVPKADVDAATADPDSLDTAADITNLGGVKVNMLPIPASNLLTDAEASDISFAKEVFFFGDDNNPPVLLPASPPNPPMPTPPFADGDTFYYYVAARDIAGHPGPLSSPTQITICDRLPPSTPAIVSVDNVFDTAGSDPANETGQQHLRITIRQVPESPAENRAYKYRVYRWHSATDWQRHGGNPAVNFIGEVNHIDGEDYVTFDDDDATDLDIDGPGGSGPDGLGGVDTGAPVVNSESDPAMGQTFWYTVRAVDGSACTPENMSGHCGAVYGVPRDRVGPPQPIGSLISCFCIPRVNLANEGVAVPRPPYGVPQSFPGFVVRVSRLDNEDRDRVLKKIKSVDIQYGEEKFDQQQNFTFDPVFSRTYFFKGMEPFADVLVPNRPADGLVIRVRSRLGDGSVSRWATVGTIGGQPKLGEIFRYDFRAWIEVCCPTLISSSVLRNKDGSIDERILALLPPQSSDEDCPAWIEVDPGSVPPGTNPVGPDDSITGVCGNVYLFDDIREVRIYRRVGTAGKLTLIARQSGESALPTVYSWKESAPVLINGIEACYYAQTFDENGNASPLTRIGCVTVVNEDLGVPMMMDPVDLDPSGSDALVKLSWFCDPVGIDRFEVWAAAEGGESPGITSFDLTSEISTEISPVLNTEAEEDLTFSVYRTTSLASGFGNGGGEFCLTVAVPADKKIYYAIRPIGAQLPDQVTGEYEYAIGDFSNIVSDKWVAPPAALQDVVPWPAKPLPSIAGVSVPVDSYIAEEGPYYAHPIIPETMNSMGASAGILVGAYPAVFSNEQSQKGNFLANRDPMDWLFKYRKQPGESVSSDDLEALAPFIIYRYQVSSPRYPNAKPNLVQVTPLIDRMAYQTLSSKDQNGREFDYYCVQDPFFLFTPLDQSSPVPMPVPLSGLFSRDPASFTTGIASSNDPAANPPYLQPENINGPGGGSPAYRILSAIWVRDTQPVAEGASYQYLIVPFTERGEIKRVIPTNTISH